MILKHPSHAFFFNFSPTGNFSRDEAVRVRRGRAQSRRKSAHQRHELLHHGQGRGVLRQADEVLKSLLHW